MGYPKFHKASYQTSTKNLFSQELISRFQADGQPVDLAPRDKLALNTACFVISGCIKIWRTLPNGADHIITFAYAGSLLFGQTERSETLQITALNHSRVSLIKSGQIAVLSAENPAWGNDILEATFAQIRSLQHQTAMFARMSACERVALFLKLLAEAGACDRRNLLRLRLPMSRMEIGDHLGLTIETVSRSMTRLRKEGFIACPARNEVLVLNPKGLENFYERD